MKILLCFILLLSAPLFAKSKTAKKVKKTNNSGIVEVTKIYNTNQKNREKWTTKNQEWGYCNSVIDVRRELVTDEKGVGRIYIKTNGGEDSSVTIEHHYDHQKRLRFVFLTAAAINGSNLEHRIYFDTKGGRIKESHQFVKGEGYPFPNPWPKEDLVTDPLTAYASKNQCPGE